MIIPFTLFIEISMSGVTPSKLKKRGECSICGENNGLRMRCGHYICRSDILENALHQIRSRSHKITCAECTEIIDLDYLIKVGFPSDEVKRKLTKEITVNFCNTQEIQQCPLCSTYLVREDTNTNRTDCPICSKHGILYRFCWTCLRVWDSPEGSKSCGNNNCGILNLEQLKNPPMKVFNSDYGGEEISAPSYRACPGCFTFIEHESGCNAMTCRKCSKVFCFICLRNTCKTTTWNGNIRCAAAPIQNLDKICLN